MTEWEKIKANLKTEEELLAEGWSLHTTCDHILGGSAKASQLGRDNPDLEFDLVPDDFDWGVKIMSRTKE
jgi:hypothetical protein